MTVRSTKIATFAQSILDINWNSCLRESRYGGNIKNIEELWYIFDISANAIGITVKINSRSEKTGEESSLSYFEGHPVEGTCLILSTVDWKVGYRIHDTEIIQGYPQRMGLQRRLNGI